MWQIITNILEQIFGKSIFVYLCLIYKITACEWILECMYEWKKLYDYFLSIIAWGQILGDWINTWVLWPSFFDGLISRDTPLKMVSFLLYVLRGVYFNHISGLVHWLQCCWVWYSTHGSGLIILTDFLPIDFFWVNCLGSDMQWARINAI